MQSCSHPEKETKRTVNGGGARKCCLQGSRTCRLIITFMMFVGQTIFCVGGGGRAQDLVVGLLRQSCLTDSVVYQNIIQKTHVFGQPRLRSSCLRWFGSKVSSRRVHETLSKFQDDNLRGMPEMNGWSCQASAKVLSMPVPTKDERVWHDSVNAVQDTQDTQDTQEREECTECADTRQRTVSSAG